MHNFSTKEFSSNVSLKCPGNAFLTRKLLKEYNDHFDQKKLGQESNCLFLLLPACKVEKRVKRQIFCQAGGEFRMRVTPAWYGWVGMIVCTSLLKTLISFCFHLESFFKFHRSAIQIILAVASLCIFYPYIKTLHSIDSINVITSYARTILT